jgi:nitroimidazol reductase NimA-like FMN-containing flavoprotein (pyridoxamine 5'-phosphate oxidase superfamily)
MTAMLEIQRRSYARATEGLRAAWPERQALDAAGLEALLGRHRYCVLATARADGRAHAAPVAFAVVDGAFWIATVEGLRMRNLRARPWASLVVMEGDADEGEAGEPHRALTAEGPVELHEVGAVWPRLEAEWLARHGHSPDWAEVFVELRPVRVFSHDASR